MDSVYEGRQSTRTSTGGAICKNFVWLCGIVYLVGVIVGIPILIIRDKNKGHDNDNNGSLKKRQAVMVASAFVLLALPVSLVHIASHVFHYNRPHLQKHVIRILWMVPIYAVNAWMGLLYPEQSIYIDSLRECYEAFVIYSFMKYLLNDLTQDRDLEMALELKPQIDHMFPLCCLTPWEMGREFIHMCKHGILQYTVVRPVMTLLAVFCELGGVYGEGIFKANYAFPYISAVNNFSQFLAMYCLVLFYRANSEELAHMKPIGKFLCIKAVVFFSFFQGFIITILVYYKVISHIFDTEDEDQIKNLASELQDFLICIEMFFAAIAHQYSFSYKQFVTEEIEEGATCFGSFCAMLDISDVKTDITEHIGVLGNSVSRRLRGKTMYHMAKGTDESSRLVSDAGPSNRATSINCEGNEEIIHQINVENPNVSYGSTENTRPTQPLLDDNNRHDKIC